MEPKFSLLEQLERVAGGAYDSFLENQEGTPVLEVLGRGAQRVEDMALLLSPGAIPHLELLANRGQQLTRSHFGNTMQLYAPLYISDYCVNQCTYCGFRAGNQHNRSKLSLSDVQKQCQWLAHEGFRNILLVAGESQKHCSVSYLAEVATAVQGFAPWVGIEVYPLSVTDYRTLHLAGVESLTLYQETFDRRIYRAVHPAGPKSDFDYRLEAVERGCKAGFNSVQLGVLMGLGPWRRDVLSLAIHGRWLERQYPETRIGFSLPRLRPAAGADEAVVPVQDHEFVQSLLALRQWMPGADLTLSTRETEALRNGLMPLCITKVSAGSCTSVGGYGKPATGDEQFQISDDRTLLQMKNALTNMNLEPVLGDWVPLRGGIYHG